MKRTHPGYQPSGRLIYVWLALGVLAVGVFAFRSPYFLSADNLLNIVGDVAEAGVVAVPATFLIMTGAVDLSVGATAGFAGVVLAAQAPRQGLAAAIVLVVGIGLIIGIANALLVTLLGLDSVLVTFGVMALLRGLSYLIPSGLAVVVPGFSALAYAHPLLGIPLPALIFLAEAAVGLTAARRSFGRRISELGRQPREKRLASPRDRWTLVSLFGLTALGATLAGLIRTSELSTGLPTAGTGLEITVTAAVLLGGGRLSGGRGSIPGTMVTLVVISVVDNGLSLANVSSYVNQVFQAALMVGALIAARPGRRPDHIADRQAEIRPGQQPDRADGAAP